VGGERNIVWSSSDLSILDIVITDPTGAKATVTAKDGGTVTLSVSVDGVTEAECIVRVRHDRNGSAMQADPHAQIIHYLSGIFNEAYAPHYDGLHFLVSQFEESVDGTDYTSTFLWTMYHLSNGLDIPSDFGKEQEVNWRLQATARITGGGQLDMSTIVVLADDSATGPATYRVPVADYFPPPPAVPPIDFELVRNYIELYMQLVTDGDTTELARFLLIDGGVTDQYIAIAQRVIEYYAQYDTGGAIVLHVHYHEFELERQYIIIVRDGRGEMFKVYAGYGDGLVGIDVRMFG
jgi:hypothetical protein